MLLYISHRLEEVFEVADRIRVLRDGEVMGTLKTSATDQRQLIKMMVGRTVDEIYPRRETQPGETILTIKDFARAEAFQQISFSLARGEILGLFGLVGSGRTEVARSIFSAELPTVGDLQLAGKAIRPKSPYEALKAGD